MYKDYNDFELVDMIAENNEIAMTIMYKKYEPLIFSSAKRLFEYCNGTGLELNDLIQEGMLGLSKAIDSFTEKKDTLFYTYAKTCIERKIISSIITARRLKHKILNESISIEKDVLNGETITLENFLADQDGNPERLILKKESEEEILTILEKEFTPFEKQVFELKKNGFEYKEIAEIMRKDPKSIDNALQRIRAKIKKYLSTR